MNIAVINIKDILKKIVLIVIVVSILISAFVFAKNLNLNYYLNEIIVCSKCMETVLPNINEKKHIKATNISLAKTILDLEFGAKNNIIKDLNINEEELTVDDLQEIIEITDPKKQEEIIEPVNNNKFSTSDIKNQTDYEITADMLDTNIEIDKSKSILIFHTHTCESYTPSEKYNYEMTGNYRTTDLNYSVARVGLELKNKLESKDISVIQDNTYHDYPAYSGSYSRSEKTVRNILENSNSEIVIDLHRDAVGDGSSYGPTAEINNETVARLMFVVGTNGGGLEHPNWRENLKFAIKVQEKANQLYPRIVFTNFIN